MATSHPKEGREVQVCCLPGRAAALGAPTRWPPTAYLTVEASGLPLIVKHNTILPYLPLFSAQVSPAREEKG